jgi:hypothetical protein
VRRGLEVETGDLVTGTPAMKDEEVRGDPREIRRVPEKKLDKVMKRVKIPHDPCLADISDNFKRRIVN